MRRIAAAAVIVATLAALAGARVAAQNIVLAGPSVDLSHGRLALSLSGRYGMGAVS